MKQSVIADHLMFLSLIIQVIGYAGVAFGWFSWYIALPISCIALGVTIVSLVWFVTAMRAEIKVIDGNIAKSEKELVELEKSNAEAEVRLAEMKRHNAEEEVRLAEMKRANAETAARLRSEG